MRGNKSAATATTNTTRGRSQNHRMEDQENQSRGNVASNTRAGGSSNEIGGKIKSTYTKLEPQRVIGSGSFGYVFEAIDQESNTTVAVKRTQKAGEFVSREYEVLNRLKGCKNVVKMLEIYYSRSKDGKTA